MSSRIVRLSRRRQFTLLLSVIVFLSLLQTTFCQTEASTRSIFPHYVLADLLPRGSVGGRIGYDTRLTFLAETTTSVTIVIHPDGGNPIEKQISLEEGSLHTAKVSTLLGFSPGFHNLPLSTGWLEVLSDEPIGVTEEILQFIVGGFPATVLNFRLTTLERSIPFKTALFPWGGPRSSGQYQRRGSLIGIGIALLNDGHRERTVSLRLVTEGTEISSLEVKIDPGQRLLRFLSEIFTDVDVTSFFFPGDKSADEAVVFVQGDSGGLRMVAIRVVADDFTVSDTAGERVIFLPLAESPLSIYTLQRE